MMTDDCPDPLRRPTKAVRGAAAAAALPAATTDCSLAWLPGLPACWLAVCRPSHRAALPGLPPCAPLLLTQNMLQGFRW